jgi:hypothetical protein
MEREEQVEFVNNLIDNIKDDILLVIHKAPAEWDGLELRELIADWFCESTSRRALGRKRLKEYKNYATITYWMPGPRR